MRERDVGEVLAQTLSHAPAQIGESVAGLASVQDAVGIVDLTVTADVHDGLGHGGYDSFFGRLARPHPGPRVGS